MEDKLAKLIKHANARRNFCVGVIVDNAKLVESKMGEVISIYIQPTDEKLDFVTKVLLSNRFLSFGDKVNLLKYINKQENLLKGKEKNVFFEKLHKILNIRNAFAHDMGESSLSQEEGKSMEFHYSVKTFSGEDFKSLDYNESIEDFKKAAFEVIEQLKSIIEKIR